MEELNNGDSAGVIQTCNKYYLHDFLSSDLTIPGTNLKQLMERYQVVLEVAAMTVDSIKKKQLENFDPLVGDCACQVRAAYIASTFDDCSGKITSLEEGVIAVRERVDSLLPHISKLEEKYQTAQELFDEERLNIEMSEEEFYFTHCFILSISKENKPFEKTENWASIKEKIGQMKGFEEFVDIEKIDHIRPTSKSFKKFLVKFSRHYLSSHTVSFLRRLSKKFSIYEKMYSQKFVVIYNGLECSPFFWSGPLLLRFLSETKTPLVLHAKQVAEDQGYRVLKETKLCFQACDNGFKEIESKNVDINTISFVIEGCTARNSAALPEFEEWRDELLSHSIEDHILANLAAHNQYIDSSNDTLLESLNCTEYENYRSNAKSWGCSSHNPSLFFAFHIYPEKIGNLNFKNIEYSSEEYSIDRTATLSQVKLFQYLESDILHAIADKIHVRDMERGETILSAGEPADGLYIITSGEVAIFYGETQVKTLKACDFFGEIGALTKSVRLATAKVEREGTLFYIDQREFEAITSKCPEVLRAISHAVISYLLHALEMNENSIDHW